VKKKRRQHRPTHRRPVVQVVQLGPDFWCPDCGFLELADFSSSIEEPYERASQSFADRYAHGLS
jgi:hypothetical protein